MGAQSESLSPSVQRRHESHTVATHLALLISLSLLLTWPVLIHGVPDISHDGFHHARWAKQFGTQFWQGDLFPRWFTNVNGGFGGPSGFFCPPFTNYVATLFWPLTAGKDPQGWLAAGYSVVLGAILSGITAYFWLLSFGSARAALLGSAVYLLAPYHIAIDIYMRGAASEFWVFAWFPLVLLSAQLLIRGSKWALPLAAASFGLAVLSHPTTSLCFAVLPISFVFCFSETKERFRKAALMTGALLVGVGLSAAYLLPAMLDQGVAHTKLYLTGHFDYHGEWLVQSTRQLVQLIQFAGGKSMIHFSDRWDFPIRLRILEVTLSTLLLILALFLVIRRRESADRPRSVAQFWIIAAFAFFFLMNKPSWFVWSAVGFLKFLQFPFRLNIMLALCAAALAALAYQHLLQPGTKLLTGFVCLMLVCWAGVDLYSSRVNSSGLKVTNEGRFEEYKDYIRTQLDSPEMWPRPGNSAALSNIAALDWLTATHPPKAVHLEEIYHQSSGTVTVEKWQPRRLRLSVDALRSSTLTVNQFYDSGWRARMEGSSERLAAHPSADGFIQVDVPRGRYDLVVELPRDGAERSGILISLLSLLLVVGGCVWAWRRQPGMARISPELGWFAARPDLSRIGTASLRNSRLGR